jgi:hypothetical protein
MLSAHFMIMIGVKSMLCLACYRFAAVGYLVWP